MIVKIALPAMTMGWRARREAFAGCGTRSGSRRARGLRGVMRVGSTGRAIGGATVESRGGDADAGVDPGACTSGAAGVAAFSVSFGRVSSALIFECSSAQRAVQTEMTSRQQGMLQRRI
jgi:hypothetical protein